MTFVLMIIITLAIFLELCSLSHIPLASIASETYIHFTNKNAYDLCKASEVNHSGY